jgi:hypothetical protein
VGDDTVRHGRLIGLVGSAARAGRLEHHGRAVLAGAVETHLVEVAIVISAAPRSLLPSPPPRSTGSAPRDIAAAGFLPDRRPT